MLLRLKKNRKGFTLIELIVVVAIIAILAAIAIPNYIGMQDKAQQGVDIANATAIVGAINTWNAMQIVGGATETRIAAADAAKGVLDALDPSMWPIMQGGSATAEADAIARITVTDFVATVSDTAVK